MSCCLAKWVVPYLAPLLRLLGGVYRAVAWQWTPGSDSTIAVLGRHVTIYTDHKVISFPSKLLLLVLLLLLLLLLFLVNDQALCHEDAWGSGGIAPVLLTSALD
jgi:hypothetical protein